MSLQRVDLSWAVVQAATSPVADIRKGVRFALDTRTGVYYIFWCGWGHHPESSDVSDPNRMYEIRCPVHGFISFNDWEREVINHPAFQRLRRIR